MNGFENYDNTLESLKSRGRYRSLIARSGHDFSSNDYLGLAASKTLREAALEALQRGVDVGSGGSRLLRGNTDEHSALEAQTAEFFGAEQALFLGSGFVANMAIFSTLPRPGDLILYDALIHASAHDGMKLGRADTMAFHHNDAIHAETVIKDWRENGGRGRVWIAVESVYSMDGDLAPIAELMEIAARHEAVLIVDEAHATGLFGDGGRGLSHAYAARPNLLSLHTCGKALGVSGALVCGASVLIETLINKARSFIFSTAPSPLDAALVRAALRDIETNPARRKAAHALIAHAHHEAHEKCGLTGLQSQIIPVIIGNDKKTMQLAERLQSLGFDVRGIRPPSVARGTARLRVSITLNVSENIVSAMFETLAREHEKKA